MVRVGKSPPPPAPNMYTHETMWFLFCVTQDPVSKSSPTKGLAQRVPDLMLAEKSGKVPAEKRGKVDASPINSENPGSQSFSSGRTDPKGPEETECRNPSLKWEDGSWYCHYSVMQTLIHQISTLTAAEGMNMAEVKAWPAASLLLQRRS